MKIIHIRLNKLCQEHTLDFDNKPEVGRRTAVHSTAIIVFVAICVLAAGRNLEVGTYETLGERNSSSLIRNWKRIGIVFQVPILF